MTAKPSPTRLSAYPKPPAGTGQGWGRLGDKPGTTQLLNPAAFTITYLLEYLFVIDFLVSAWLWSPRLLSALRFLSGKTPFWSFHGMEESLTSRIVNGGNNTKTSTEGTGIEASPQSLNRVFESVQCPSAWRSTLPRNLAYTKTM
jgi:hypothetical protein